MDGHERVRGLAREADSLTAAAAAAASSSRRARGPANSVSQRVLRASARARSCASFWLAASAILSSERRWLDVVDDRLCGECRARGCLARSRRGPGAERSFSPRGAR